MFYWGSVGLVFNLCLKIIMVIMAIMVTFCTSVYIPELVDVCRCCAGEGAVFTVPAFLWFNQHQKRPDAGTRTFLY